MDARYVDEQGTWQSFISWAEWAIGGAWEGLCIIGWLGAFVLMSLVVAITAIAIANIKGRGELVPEQPPKPEPDFSISD